jgi:hypothetical protein
MRIENATLDDDAEYQCQVGPKGSQKPIRSDARLTVLSKLSIDKLSLDTRTCLQRLYLVEGAHAKSSPMKRTGSPKSRLGFF